MHNELARIWQHTQDELKASVLEPSYDQWLAPLRALRVEGDCLYIGAPRSVRTWVEQRYASLIGRAVRRHAPEVCSIAFVPPASEASGKGPDAGDQGDLCPDLNLNPKYTFDQFVIGAGNRFAHSAALHVAECPGQAWNPLFIYGPPGLGKTHLLGSIAHYINRYGGGLSVRYTTAESFTNEFVAAIQRRGTEGFKRRYRRLDVLLIDDVQFLQGKAHTEEEFFHTFNALYESGSQLVLSSDRPPQEMSSLAQRLRDRFEWGLMTDVEPPELATRIAILRKRAAYDRVVIDDDGVFEAIARRVSTNIRQLEGALIRVIAFASLTRRRVDVDLVDEALRNLRAAIVRAEPTVEAIQQTVSSFFGIEPDEMRAAKRTGRLVYPRQIAMYLSRELTDLSLPGIGRAFGGRDHTTVMHAVRKVGVRMQEDRQTCDLVRELTDKIHSRPGEAL